MIKYADKNVGWIVYPIFAISFIFFANDNDFETLIKIPSFKWDILFALVTASIVGFYLGWLVRYLDKNEKTSWQNAPRKRFLLQSLYGILLPLLISIGLEIIYLDWIDIQLSESSILNLELPLAFIYLSIINLLYYLNFVSQFHRLELESVKEQKTKAYNQKISIQEGYKENLISIEAIAFVRSAEKITWLHSFDEKQSYLKGTLNEWEQKLPKEKFYRLNRQFIAHRNAIQSIEATNTRRLKVFLIGFSQEVYVPKTKASDFRKWLQS